MSEWSFYRDTKGEWRWRRQAANGRIVAAATEGYVDWSACVENARLSGYEPDADQTGAYPIEGSGGTDGDYI